MTKYDKYEHLLKESLLHFEFTCDEIGLNACSSAMFDRYGTSKRNILANVDLGKILTACFHQEDVGIDSFIFTRLEDVADILLDDRSGDSILTKYGVEWAGFSYYERAQVLNNELLAQYRKTARYFKFILSSGSILTVLSTDYPAMQLCSWSEYKEYFSKGRHAAPSFTFGEYGNYLLQLINIHKPGYSVTPDDTSKYLSVNKNLVFRVYNTKRNTAVKIMSRYSHLRDVLNRVK